MNTRTPNHQTWAAQELATAAFGDARLAKRLVRYISDPSTVRVRVLSEWGHAPSVDRISRFRADHVAKQAKFLSRGRMAT